MKRNPFVSRMRQVLERRREALRKSFAGELRQLDIGNESAVGDHADAAVESDTEEISSRLAAVESRELQAIQRALRRIEQGRYGVCDTCGGKIPVLRLEALPYATQCVRCQRSAEQTVERGAARFEWPGELGVSGADEDTEPGYSESLA